ncbi:hypothetical protein C8F04DRAFT_1227115 [Mycena alexandri]|uniref:F-box domain-containing protein n=1 Tax=Mycena alexandri TaxID=1745969 RepID=A0AAD6XEF2_9AGAR|nr:hypothetical protein C8F04DRAFT_1227115 [Mycena alexandri]
MSIGSFPPELLAQIFAAASLNTREITEISHVSQQWRNAVLGASELWLHVHITDYDLEHIDIFLEHLRRSQQRPIQLQLELVSSQPIATLTQTRAFFEAVVVPHLTRCYSLTIHAERPVWEVFLAVCGQQTFPLLRKLDVMDLHWDHGPSPENLAFPLPLIHPLKELAVHTMSIGHATLPLLRVLRAGGHLLRLVGPDGRIDRWFLDGPQRLELCDLPVPRMHFQTEEERSNAISSVVYLKLSKLFASISTHGTQNDLTPFFDALQTPNVRTLELESFYGRAWDDFLFSLSVHKTKYPRLTALVLKSFDFRDREEHFARTKYILRSFPGLESVVLVKCPASTWEIVLYVLMLYPTLCPSVHMIEVDGVLLERNEPLPFALACLYPDKREERRRQAFFSDQD